MKPKVLLCVLSVLFGLVVAGMATAGPQPDRPPVPKLAPDRRLPPPPALPQPVPPPSVQLPVVARPPAAETARATAAAQAAQLRVQRARAARRAARKAARRTATAVARESRAARNFLAPRIRAAPRAKTDSAKGGLRFLVAVVCGAALILALAFALARTLPRRRRSRVLAKPREDLGRPSRSETTLRRDLVLFRRLVRELRGFRLRIAGVFALSLLATPLTLLTPVPLAITVDSVLGDHPLPPFLDPLIPAGLASSDNALLVLAVVMFVGVAVLTHAQELGLAVFKTHTGERLLLTFRSKLFHQSQRLSLAYHDRMGTSDSTYRVLEDAKAVQYVAVDSLISLVTAVATLVAMLYVTARIDLQLALVAMAVAPLLGLLSQTFRRRLRFRSRSVKKLESSALSVVQEVFTGLRLVKAFGQEEREHERFTGRASDGMQARVRLTFEQSAYSLLVGTVIAVGGGLVLYFGVSAVQEGRMTLGELLLVMGYLSQLFAPVKTLAKKAGTLQAHLASAERAFGLLDELPEVPERPNARRLGRASGSVLFDQVRFGYEPGRPVLHSVSFQVEPGTRVGIAGRTGAGKTTLMNLLIRLYDPSSGRILLDGVDIRDYRLADLRNQFGIVLQDPVLFSTSIGENIAYGRADASRREIEAAAAAANAHEFITELPEGYDTQVGERGMRLSGGERQRVSLARAFLKDAPILILDEPTSSVDIRTEALIVEAMERLTAGRTSFLIAHRLSTLEFCDVRLEVEAGVFNGGIPRCRATTRTGKRCRRTPLPGRDHCPSHQHLERSHLAAVDDGHVTERALPASHENGTRPAQADHVSPAEAERA